MQHQIPQLDGQGNVLLPKVKPQKQQSERTTQITIDSTITNSNGDQFDSMFHVEESLAFRFLKLILLQLFITLTLCSLAYWNAAYRHQIYGEGSIYICIVLTMMLFYLVFLLKNLTTLRIFILTLGNLTAADCSIYYEILTNGGVIVIHAALITLIVTVAFAKYADLTKTVQFQRSDRHPLVKILIVIWLIAKISYSVYSCSTTALLCGFFGLILFGGFFIIYIRVILRDTNEITNSLCDCSVLCYTVYQLFQSCSLLCEFQYGQYN